MGYVYYIYTVYNSHIYIYIYTYRWSIRNSQFITLCGLKKWLLAFHHCTIVHTLADALSSALQHAHPTAGFLVRSIKATPTLQNHLLLHLPSSNLTWQCNSPVPVRWIFKRFTHPKKITMDYNLKSKLLSQTTIFFERSWKKRISTAGSMQNQMVKSLHLQPIKTLTATNHFRYDLGCEVIPLLFLTMAGKWRFRLGSPRFFFGKHLPKN